MYVFVDQFFYTEPLSKYIYLAFIEKKPQFLIHIYVVLHFITSLQNHGRNF